MTVSNRWLPPLVTLKDYRGNWDKYIEVVYRCFKSDFIRHSPVFNGKPVCLKKYPIERGKEATFWHVVSEGMQEHNRVPDLRRCERIRWPAALIAEADSPLVKCWANARRGDKRIVIALNDFSYVVVLAVRDPYYLLWTAYCVEQEHSRRKMENEYKREGPFQKS